MKQIKQGTKRRKKRNKREDKIEEKKGAKRLVSGNWNEFENRFCYYYNNG